jgi:hypothetical protein
MEVKLDGRKPAAKHGNIWEDFAWYNGVILIGPRQQYAQRTLEVNNRRGPVLIWAADSSEG